jgi:MFS family permease
MFGLALFSQTQFIDLHTRWNLLGLPVSGEISRRWALFSLVFFGILAIAVAFLPTSYSLGFLGVLGLGLGFIYGALFFIGQAILTALLTIMSLLFMLLGFKSPIQGDPLGAPPVQPPAEKLPPTVPVAWLELLKSLAFWAALVAILLFALLQYLRQHQEVLDALRKIPLVRMLAQFWHWLRGLFAEVRLSVSKVLAQGLERLRPRSEAETSRPLGSFLSLRRLNARQKIMFFYLALLRRGHDSGLTRQASQTPHEYAASLDAALPGVEPEINSLTEAFIEARYSPHPVPVEQVNRVKDYWERIKKALRGKSNQKSS